MSNNNVHSNSPYSHISDSVKDRASLSAVSQILSDAERGYVRHFDLFSSVYYQNNRPKRELAAKRYAVLNMCNTLIETGTYTKKEIFEAYKSFKTSSISHYNAFLRKLKEFQADGATSCTHGRIGEKYQYKVKDFVGFELFRYLYDPHQYSASQIAEWINYAIAKYNTTHSATYKPISPSTVYHYSTLHRNEINYFREGKSRFHTATRPYFNRIGALNAGSLGQLDGTPVQMFCWNHPSKWKTEGKKLIRPNLFAFRDTHSGKVLGFDVAESEDRFNVLNPIKMAANIHGHLPAEIVHDNSSATKTDEFKAVKAEMENRGVIVRAAKVGNAQDKGEIERFWGTFQSRFQRLIDGYIGEGIRSKRANGRISEEFLKRHQKENGHYSYDEMLKIIAELIAIYNNSIISNENGDKTPNQLYSECEKPHVKPVDYLAYAQMFWMNKTLKVSKSMIIHEVRKQKRIYEIWENEHKLLLNGKDARIYYDETDPSEIHVYTLEGQFICTCKQHIGIHEAQVDQAENEGTRIAKHVAHRDSIDGYVEEKADKRLKAYASTTKGVFDTLNPKEIEKEKLNNAESQALLNNFYQTNGINSDKVKERETIEQPYKKEKKETVTARVNNFKSKGTCEPVLQS